MNKRNEINLKVSVKRRKTPREKECQSCGKIYSPRRGDQASCSVKCASKLRSKSSEYRQKMSILMTNRILRGDHTKFLKSIKCEYVFKEEKIKCDSKVEYSCLNYFETNFKIKSMKRCNFYLEFQHEGVKRRYVPDFIIETENEKFIIECKTEIGKNKDVSRKWSYYYDTIEEKKKALEKFCEKEGFKSFFYTKNLNSAFYYSLKF